MAKREVALFIFTEVVHFDNMADRLNVLYFLPSL